jgi:UDP-3-O-[3-hydroxymyristoyl] glucosamine N-acyltransferase
MSIRLTVEEIARTVGGTVVGDGGRVVSGAGSLSRAGPEDLVFADGIKYSKDLQASKAGAAILPASMDPPQGMSGIKVAQPAVAMAKALALLFPRERAFPGISPAAHLGQGLEIQEGVGIGPGAFIGDRVKIGRGTEIHSGVTIGRDTLIGEDCILYPGVHVYHEVTLGNRVILHSGVVIGADGYGFVQERIGGASPAEPLRHCKMPQVGKVVIEDDVEVGANSTIDRAALDETVIGRGTKIDNLVMIAHNCRIGRHSLVIAQVGVSGSVETGDYVTLAGQAGIAGHLRIGSRAIVGAQAGVTKDIPDGQVVLGSPAVDARLGRKAYTLIDSLPEFKKTLAEHEKRLAQVQERLGFPGSPGSAEKSGGT